MSYQEKLRLMIVLLLAISVGLSGAWLITASFDDALGREITAAQTEQRMALYLFAAGGAAEDNQATAAAIHTLERQTGQPFRLTNANGKVLCPPSRSGTFQNGLTKHADSQTMAWRIQRAADGHVRQIAGAIRRGNAAL